MGPFFTRYAITKSTVDIPNNILYSYKKFNR